MLRWSERGTRRGLEDGAIHAELKVAKKCNEWMNVFMTKLCYLWFWNYCKQIVNYLLCVARGWKRGVGGKGIGVFEIYFPHFDVIYWNIFTTPADVQREGWASVVTNLRKDPHHDELEFNVFVTAPSPPRRLELFTEFSITETTSECEIKWKKCFS